jgi:hypothetical protein
VLIASFVLLESQALLVGSFCVLAAIDAAAFAVLASRARDNDRIFRALALSAVLAAGSVLLALYPASTAFYRVGYALPTWAVCTAILELLALKPATRDVPHAWLYTLSVTGRMLVGVVVVGLLATTTADRALLGGLQVYALCSGAGLAAFTVSLRRVPTRLPYMGRFADYSIWR